MQEQLHHGAEASEEPNIEVWNDLVSAKDLVVSLAVCAACAIIALVIAERTGGQLLFWGLGGAVLGFIINCVIVTPKREVSIVDIDEHGDPIAVGDAITPQEDAR